ncbi:MAG: sugar phosphate isomerase/epimerase [Armatimonadetes bacterium]|nr:sugar phosphate isomerase/epimerase [Armatimonadota bacterium]
MKLGYTTYDNLNALDFAKEAGFECLEFTTLPNYPGIDLVAELDTPAKVAEFKHMIDESGIEVGSIITALNPLSADPAVASAHTDYFKNLIKLAGTLGIPCVSSTSGQNPTISLDDNVKLFGKVYNELVKAAENSGVKIVFENCLHGYPHGQNIAVNPETWQKVFNEVDSPNLGLEFDPSHLVFQFIDPVKAAREFVSKIFIVHAKDTEILEDELARGGIYSLVGYWRFRLPGYGDVDWPRLFQVLREGGFDGNVVIEHEDPVFEGERRQEGLLIGKRYLSQFVW